MLDQENLPSQTIEKLDQDKTVKTCQTDQMDVGGHSQHYLTRRQSQAAVLQRESQAFNSLNKQSQAALRRESQGNSLNKQSQAVVRRESQGNTLNKQSQADILKRTTKKNSIANAVAVVGITEALLVGNVACDVDYSY